MLKKIILISLPILSVGAFASYNVIINKQNNNYEVTNSIWTNTGIEFNCSNPSPLASEVEIGTSFTQSYSCQQNQERTVSGVNEQRNISIPYNQEFIGTSDWVNYGVEFNCENYLPSVTEVEVGESFIQSYECQQEQSKSILNVMQQQFLTVSHSQTQTGTSDWINVGLEFNCEHYLPSVSEIEIGESFTQNYECQQEQNKSILGVIQQNLITIQHTQNRIGTSDWINVGIEFNCEHYLPSVSEVEIGESFIQNYECQQEQSKSILNVIQQQFLTISHNQNQTGTSDWINTGTEFNCANYMPLASTINNGETFTQNYDCQQEQTKSILGNPQQQFLTIPHSHDILGTFLVSNSSCLDVKNSGQTLSGNYLINPTGSENITAYCDMTTDGGGWTLVYYSNSGSVDRSLLDTSDWNSGSSVNFSYLYSFKDVKPSGKYEFYIHDSSTSLINVIFNQTNSYLENPKGNNFTQTGGNFYYPSFVTGWKGLALGSFGEVANQQYCSLSMVEYGSSWWFCLQDQDPLNFGTGPWFTAGNGQEPNAGQWVKVYQR